ncbi:type VI secretion system baseplate subunit TssK [Nannocystaceae bacterium ST9]
MSSKLAFPGWAMGQVLLPEQFQAQQEVILAHLALRAELTGLPAYGLARFGIDEELLATGSLRVERLTYAFASGLLVDVPGNTVLTNVNLAMVTNDVAIIYLHVHNEVTDATDLVRYEEDPRSVRRVIYRAELSLAAQLDDARESVKLLELVRRDREWHLAAHSPPLLRTGGRSSPFLRESLAGSQRAVRAVEAQVGRRIRDAFLGREQVSELRRVLAAAHRVLALLADHGVGDEAQFRVSLHPYLVFSGLRDFLLDAALLQDAAFTLPQYRHDDLAGCFEELRRGIEGTLGTATLGTNRLEFEPRANLVVAGPFPEALCTAKQVFLIVKSRSGEPVEFAGVKLASPRRIDEVHTRALPGVPLVAMSPTSAASFAIIYGYDALVFEVDTRDPEWSLTLREGELAFPAWRELEGVIATLVWGA